MKEKIVAFINNLKIAFANRRSNMPTVRFHKPHIQSLATDESALESASGLFAKLDDTQKKPFAENALYYLMETVLPIFRNWKVRTKAITKAHQEDSIAHSNAIQDYKERKKELRSLIAQLNVIDGEQIISIEPNVDNPGKVIMQQYQREKFVSDHKIQLAEKVKMDDGVGLKAKIVSL